jgi:hypothetical protein
MLCTFLHSSNEELSEESNFDEVFMLDHVKSVNGIFAESLTRKDLAVKVISIQSKTVSNIFS